MANLLVVEDDDAMLTGITDALALNGHDVRAARSGWSALEAVIEDTPELIISDIQMPEMDGLQLMDAVRGHHELANMPFLFISGATTAALLEQVNAARDVMFLPKPFEIDTLQETVRTALSELNCC